MFKKIIFAAILLITVAAVQARNFTAVNNFTTIVSIPDDDLVNKIAADNDFKNYYISNVKFANKVIETNAGSLFLKYIQNKITVEESNSLFAKMNVRGKQEFDAIAVNLRNEAVAFFNKFPELKLKTEKEQRELLVSALQKISTDNSITTKFVKARYITEAECFWSWMVCCSLSAITCSYAQEYNACIWTMAEVCAGAYSICWFMAE